MVTNTPVLGWAFPAKPGFQSMGAWFVALATATLFAIDCFTPLGFAIPFFYVLILWVVLVRGTPRQMLAVAAAGSVLTVAGLFLSPGDDLRTGLTNRTVTLFALWFLAYFGIAYRKAVDTLCKRECELTDFVENALVGIHWVAPDGTILGVNQEELDMLGYGRDEYVGRNVIDFHVDREVAEEILAKLNANVPLKDCAARLRHKDGSIRHVLISCNVYQEDGRFIHSRCFTQDITDRVRAELAESESKQLAAANARLVEETAERRSTELALREREELLQATFDSAPVGIFMADLDGRFVKANAAYQLMVGYSAEELLHTSVHRLTHPDDVHQNRVLRQDLVTGKREFYEIDKRYCSRDGRLIWVRNKGSLIKDALGGPRYMIVVSQDITERKMAEEALRRSREMFAALVNSVDGIVWEADARTFRFTFVSQQAERLLGYPVERWLNESGFWKDHIHPDDRDWAVDFCVAATREKRAHDFEYRMLASDGRTVWVRDLVTVVVEDGQAARLRGIIVDITGYKAADRALQESERRLRLALEEREHLSRDLHDHIIQAIYAIGMQLETCQRSLRDDPKEPAIQLARVITGLNGVMHDMRRYLSGSESRIPDEPRLDVELVKLVKTIGATGTLRFRLKLDPAVIAQLNPEQAEHLLHVAREAMGNALRHSRARHARLSLQDAGAGVRLEIRDDGVGFDPRGVKRDSGGLHNMECRARQLGGRFEVLSSPGGGAAIILVIPKGSAVNDTQ